METAAPTTAAEPVVNKNQHHVVVRKGHRGQKQYLVANSYVDQPEKEKWTTELTRADRWIVPDNASRYARRILGHDNYSVERMPT